jgi:hypothetical protein
VCPSYLDGDQATNGGPVIPVAHVHGPEGPQTRARAHAVSMDADVGIAVQFSRSAEKAPAGLAAGLSKLNSMQAPEGTRRRPGRHARSRRRLEIRGMQTWANRPLQSWSSLERR